MNSAWKNRIELLAAQIRLQSILSMGSAGGGHVGGVLSAADLFAVLYGDVLNLNPKNTQWTDRDRLVLSKGHCGPVLYAALALRGYFPLEILSTLNKNGSSLPSHCNMYDTPGVDSGTGSLGQGASIAAGIALGLKMQDNPAYTYLVLGDGECDEGQVWEMALFAAQNKLTHLIAFVDYNQQQLDGYTKDICDLGNICNKFSEFGWNSIEIDGHDVEAIKSAIESAKKEASRPSMIVLETIKGKGWSVTEGKPNIHHSTISPKQMEEARAEFGLLIGQLEKRSEMAI